MKNLLTAIILSTSLLSGGSRVAEFHVATNSNDANPGTERAPFRTIQRAADLAQPSDFITVHAGVYRERINPPRGGTSDTKRITYQAALGPDERLAVLIDDAIKAIETAKKPDWEMISIAQHLKSSQLGERFSSNKHLPF